MRYVLSVCAAVASTLVCTHVVAGGEGLIADPDRVPWARFQARVLPSTAAAPGWRSELAPRERTGLKVASLGLLGDVYFGRSSSDANHAPRGFRATSGLIVGARQPLLGAPAVGPATGEPAGEHTVPYLGVGYSSLVAKSGWSFTADLGVVSRSPANVVRLGRVFSGGQSLDEVVRDMRLAPHVQLGVSYSF